MTSVHIGTELRVADTILAHAQVSICEKDFGVAGDHNQNM